MPEPDFSPVRCRPGWSRADAAGDGDALEELAKTLNDTRPADTYFVCGLLPDDTQLHLYRIETRDPLDIIKACEVGTQAALSYGKDAHPTVLKEMALVQARNPIVPFFADLAGFKCTFEQPVSEEFAEFLDSVITEGSEAYADEGYIAPVVMRTKFLQLWWD